MEVVHATVTSEHTEGRKFQNARYFTGPVEGASKAYVEPGYPAIVAAYEAAKVPVQIIGQPESEAAPDSEAVGGTKDELIVELTAAGVQTHAKMTKAQLLRLRADTIGARR